MQFYIPSVTDQIRLTADWEFPLFFESRNDSLLTRIKPDVTYGYRDRGSILAVLKAGTVLQVDRIYIRKGKGEWDSVTFWIKFAPGDKDRRKVVRRSSYCHEQQLQGVDPTQEMKFKGARFWAKLEDVNAIEFEKVSDDDRVK